MSCRRMTVAAMVPSGPVLTPLRYRVGDFRVRGLEARWSKTRMGAPIIVARDPNGRERHQSNQWWVVDRAAWKILTRCDPSDADAIRDAWDGITMLGDLFSVLV